MAANVAVSQSALPLSSGTNETANTATHAAALLASVAGTGVLLPVAMQAGTAEFIGCVIYSATLIALYAASTFSHWIQDEPRKSRWKMLDQVCIFLLIAGNFTPVAFTHLWHGWWPLLFVGMWSCALAGSIARVRSGNRTLAIGWYLPVGWLPVIALGEMISIGGFYGGVLVIAGGLSYTAGTWFLANDDRHPYFHCVWHIATIIGSTLHFAYVFEFVAAAA